MTNEINNTEETTTEEKTGMNPALKIGLITAGIGTAALILARCLLGTDEDIEETDDNSLSDEDAIAQVEDFLATENSNEN